MLDPHRPQPLSGRRILVVEDDHLIAEDLCGALEAQGATVLSPTPNLAQAFAVLDEGETPDGAVLDVNLGGVMVHPLADRLLERGVPILLATGYDQPSLPPAYAGVPRCEKPINMGECVRALLRWGDRPGSLPGCAEGSRLRTGGMSTRSRLVEAERKSWSVRRSQILHSMLIIPA